jgi:hypothetical protein
MRRQPVLVQSQQTAAAPQLGRSLCPRPSGYLLARLFLNILIFPGLNIDRPQGESVGAEQLLVPEGSNNQPVLVCCPLFPHHPRYCRQHL